MSTLANSANILHPAVILILCVAAGVATVMMLPSRREASIVKIGAVIALAVGLILLALLVRYAASQGGMGVYFWVFSAVAILSAFRVVTHRKPVYSALYFVLTVMASAGLFILLWAEFMAAALVIIYAGAILITYVFVIMLAQQAQDPNKPLAGLAEYDLVSRDPFIASVIGFTLMGVFLFVIFDKAEGMAKPVAPLNTAVDSPYDGSTQQLGRYLFADQLVNFELAGLILTISTVGAIIIARRRIVENLTGGFDLFETPEVSRVSEKLEVLTDSPHAIPVYGTDNPSAKAYPER